MLKWSNDQEISVFTARVLNFINPKFNDQNEIELAEVELYSFAKKCELTADEYILALELAADGKLFTEPNEEGNSGKVKLFREIDRLKLGEVKSAFLYYKTLDEQYKLGKSKIKSFLAPPKQEITTEEKKAQRINFYKTDYKRLQQEGKVLGATYFYDLIKKNGLEKVNLRFVEQILNNFIPETIETNGISHSEQMQPIKLPRIKKQDVKVFFIDAVVSAYIEKEKLKKLSESEWIDYWECIFELANI
ncbi:hypothetical protein CHRY9293_02903 [Chryseobacterium potabilaquae]|uniref:Uncharacterized protein n=2 Tax=Chryseobacterium potabilaquae TaxID=2675057 RepID=A0A6N4X7W5_9FLAO|nr:hypothetical protein CHRY9293_02903 [Chryseobacterium potabilaquae]